MKKFISLCLFSFFILLSSCKKENQLELDDNYKLDLGYTVSFNDDEFQIHFDEILEDSRCPPSAYCYWEGQARVSVITIENGIEKEFEFSTLSPIHMDTIFYTKLGDLKFEINSIDPFPNNFFTNPEEYSINFNLKKL